jgi:hypothetical protein
VFLVSAGIALYKLWPDLKHDVAGYSFSETLAKTKDAAGADARVLSVLVRGKDFSFGVVTKDGRVLERFYGELCTSSSRGNHCATRQRDHEHKATSRESELAQVRLGDIDSQILARLRRDAGAGDGDPIGLRRRQWAIGKAQPYIADADGSNVHLARSRAEKALARTVSEDSGLR